MKTDKRLRRLPQIQMPQGLLEGKKDTTVIAYVKEHRGLELEYADYLEHPVLLIAEKLRNILQKYQTDAVFQRVMLIEKETGKQSPYCFMSPPVIACAHKEESRFDVRGNVAELVLDADRVEKRRIFLAEDYHKELLVRLDVAESILRRDSNGIWFEPVKIAGRGK